MAKKTTAATKTQPRTKRVNARVAKAPAKATKTLRTKVAATGRKAVSKASVKATPKPARTGVATTESLARSLDSLLHTMRCIAQHEDELCTLLHDARKNGRVTASLRRELAAVLDKLPADEYTDDLISVRTAAAA